MSWCDAQGRSRHRAGARCRDGRQSRKAQGRRRWSSSKVTQEGWNRGTNNIAAPGDETGRSSPSSSRFLPGHLVAHFRFRGPSADLRLRDYQKLQIGETKIFHQCGAGAPPAMTSAIRRRVPALVASGSSLSLKKRASTTSAVLAKGSRENSFTI